MVKSISRVKMSGFFSTAMKYPRWSMSVKTKSWRKIAPPKQLKPNVWKSSCLFRSGLVKAFMFIVNINSSYFDL